MDVGGAFVILFTGLQHINGFGAFTMIQQENGLHHRDEHGLEPGIQRPAAVHIIHQVAGLGFVAGKGCNFSRKDGNVRAVRDVQSCGCLGNRLVLVTCIAEEQIHQGWDLNHRGLVLCKSELLCQLSLMGVEFTGVLPLSMHHGQSGFVG